MMTITPTRRPWLSSSRLALAVLLLAVGSSAMLLLTGAETLSVACAAPVQ